MFQYCVADPWAARQAISRINSRKMCCLQRMRGMRAQAQGQPKESTWKTTSSGCNKAPAATQQDEHGVWHSLRAKGVVFGAVVLLGMPCGPSLSAEPTQPGAIWTIPPSTPLVMPHHHHHLHTLKKSQVPSSTVPSDHDTTTSEPPAVPIPSDSQIQTDVTGPALPDPGINKLAPNVVPPSAEGFTKDVPDEMFEDMPNQYEPPPTPPPTRLTSPRVPGMTPEDFQLEKLTERLQDDVFTMTELSDNEQMMAAATEEMHENVHHFMTDVVPQLQATLAELDSQHSGKYGVTMMPQIQSKLSKLKTDILPGVLRELENTPQQTSRIRDSIEVLINDLLALANDLAAYRNK